MFHHLQEGAVLGAKSPGLAHQLDQSSQRSLSWPTWRSTLSSAADPLDVSGASVVPVVAAGLAGPNGPKLG